MRSNSFRLWLIVVGLTLMTVIVTLLAATSGHVK